MMQDQVDFILAQWAEERPEMDASAMGVVGRVSRLSRYLEQHLQKHFAGFGLNRGEFDVLAALLRSGKPYQLTPTNLLEAMMLSSGAMTNRLDRLEMAGLIERISHPTDRRGVFVKLTAEGLDKISPIVISHVANEQKLLSALTTDEQRQLAQLLRKLLLSFGDQVEVD